MPYTILSTGPSAAFAADHPLLTGGAAQGEVVVVLGPGAGAAAMALAPASDRVAVLVELGTECLGEYTGESRGQEGSCVLCGYAAIRWSLELVRQPATTDAVIEAARSVLESAGLEVAVCGDFVGRIVDRLVRPYYNAALRRLDEGLATADDLDTTLRLGLGYPQGPIKLLEDSGLAAHWQVSQALFEQTGDTGYAPARRATVAHRRRAGTTKDGRA